MMNPNNPFNQYNQPYMNYLNTSSMYRRRRRSSGCMIGCIPVILVIVILLAGYFYFSDHTLPQVPSFVIPILIACAVPCCARCVCPALHSQQNTGERVHDKCESIIVHTGIVYWRDRSTHL